MSRYRMAEHRVDIETHAGGFDVTHLTRDAASAPLWRTVETMHAHTLYAARALGEVTLKAAAAEAASWLTEPRVAPSGAR